MESLLCDARLHRLRNAKRIEYERKEMENRTDRASVKADS